MGKWMEMAERLEREAEARANSANSANSPSLRLVEGPIGTNDTNGTALLPAALRAGLKRLAAMPAPPITQPEVWPAIVADALRLASEGWAAQALGLRWSPLQLWGCSSKVGGNPDREGVSVCLAGRRIVRVEPEFFELDNGPGARVFFNHRSMAGDVLLWDLGSR